MQYDNLHHLLNSSSSTRRYFISLPVELQMSLHEQNSYIHTAQQLHHKVSELENYEHHRRIADGEAVYIIKA